MTPPTSEVLEERAVVDRKTDSINDVFDSLDERMRFVDLHNKHLSYLYFVERDMVDTIENPGLRGEELVEQIRAYTKIISQELNKLQEDGVYIGADKFVHYSFDSGNYYQPGGFENGLGERHPILILSGRRVKDSSLLKECNGS